MIKQKLKTNFVATGALLVTTFHLMACGVNLTDFANNNLYAHKAANKTAVPEVAENGYNDIFFEFNDGEQDLSVHGWYFKHSKEAPTVIYLHGNATNIGSLNASGLLQAFKGFQSNILVIDYPSYGKSLGLPNMLSLTSSAGEAIDWAQKNLSQKIIVWGRSLGAGVASQVVDKYADSIDGFILTSPWNTVQELIEHHFSSLAKRVPHEWISANSYESNKALAEVKTPGLILHGDKDKVIPYAFGRKLFDGLPGIHPVNFTTLEGYGHNDTFGSEQMWQEINDFIQSI